METGFGCDRRSLTNKPMPKKPNLLTSKPTHFGNRLKEMLAAKKMTGGQLHEATKINHSVLSRLLSGSQTWVSGTMLGAIAAAITKDPAEQALLIAAKLADERSVPALPEAEALVKITIGGKVPTELGRISHVPKQLEAPLKTLLNRARQDPAAEQVLIQLAASFERDL